MRSLKIFLDDLFEAYHRSDLLSSDPLEFAHRYEDAWDREVVALIAAMLAYGNVTQIRRSVADLLARMATRELGPAAWVRTLGTDSGVAQARADLQGFVHRFHRGPDMLLLLRLVESSWRAHGSLGGHFLRHLDPSDATLERALSSLLCDWKKTAARLDPRVARTSAFKHLLSSPADGSCCKRWCMFLRWMGRKDALGLDLGLWRRDSPLAATFPDGRGLEASQLVMPLDTHTGRISQYLGLTRRKSLNWKAALEVTRGLGECDPQDPTRYDFALARLGILDLCQRKYRAEVCETCQLLPVCQLAASGLKPIKRKKR